jgi:hypothetical protein
MSILEIRPMKRAATRSARWPSGLSARALGFGFFTLAAAAAPLAAHDWYTGLSSPAGDRCCTNRDCLPVAHRYDRETHRLQVRLEGAWWPVATAALLSVPSPDGMAHACFERRWLRGRMTPVIRCIILPGEV